MDSQSSDFLSGFLARPAPRPRLAFQFTPKIKQEKTQGSNRDRDKSLSYAEQLKIKDEDETLTKLLNGELDHTLGIDEINEFPEIPSAREVFERYEFEIPARNLPIATKREEILRELEKNSILIIQAATGSGKSSQVPQYILENAYKKKINVNIIVTQPRRIPAKTLADRVSIERNCQIGSLVGYQIGQNKQMNNVDTRILYCTTGVLLRKLINEKSLAKFTHIVIDEVHERDLNLDFLLLVIRRIKNATNSRVKIVLMSATMNINHIAEYFQVPFPPKILDLDVKQPFETQVSFLDDFEKLDFLQIRRDEIDLQHPYLDYRFYKTGVELISRLIEKGVKYFLVFLPGWYEIESFRQEIHQKKEIVSNFKILMLHSTMGIDSIGDVFDTRISRKIVLATNIAESSVTIPDIDFVIDFCLTKHLETDTSTNLDQLKLVYASKNNLKQREGRVGRTKKGQVIRLIYKEHFDRLPDEAPAEMQRTSLESVVLQAKRLNMGTPIDILGLALSPPTRGAIKDAILVLKEIGALTRYKEKIGSFDYSDGDMTFTGEIMSDLPIDVRFSKLIILGYIFKVMNSATIIAAGLSVRSIFEQKSQSRPEAFENKFKLGNGNSDCIAILNAYTNWRERFYESGDYDENVRRKYEKEYCIENMLDLKNLNEMHKQYVDISHRLKQNNLLDRDHIENDNEKMFVLKICIAGAFYPNHYIFGGQIPDRDAFNTLNYKNPCNTVFYKGFNKNNDKNLGDIYKDQILNHLLQNGIIKFREDAQIQFDTNSSRVFVTFKNYRDEAVKVPGEVCIEIYKALRFAQIHGNRKLTLHVMDLTTEKEYLRKKSGGETKRKGASGDSWCIYPKAYQVVDGRITYIVSPSQFFIQSRQSHEQLHNFEQKTLKPEYLKQIDDPEEFTENNLIIVKQRDRFFRSQVIATSTNQADKPFKVRLIDYGNLIDCALDEFYTCIGRTRAQRKELLQTIFLYPPMCFEAKLAKCKPDVFSQNGWSSQAIAMFRGIVQNEKNLIIEVYSFNKYDRVASVFLRLAKDRTSIQQLLDKDNLSEVSNESYIYMIEKVTNEKDTNPKNDHFSFEDYSDAPRGRIPVSLVGPLSTLNNPVFERTMKLSEGEIRTDSNSVNGILLDPYPFDGIRKVIVAANRTKNNKGRITLRQSTVMPHVLGMPCLLPLIFCPTAEFKYDKHFSQITSVLCGSGCRYDGEAYYMEHDSLFPVDIDLDSVDIKLINDLRSSMSELLGNFKGSSEQERTYLRDNSLKTLIKIMTRSRTQTPGRITDNYNWDGRNSVKADQNEINKIFPLLVTRDLVPLSFDRWDMLTKLNAELEKKARYNVRDENIKCLICDEDIESLHELKIHVLLSKHTRLAILLENQQPKTDFKMNKRIYGCDDDDDKKNIFGEGSGSSHRQKITKYQ